MNNTLKLCPFCGAYRISACDLIEEAGYCPWEEMDADEDEGVAEELDPDRLREDRDEILRLDAEAQR
jgi:hypothetical protein